MPPLADERLQRAVEQADLVHALQHRLRLDVVGAQIEPDPGKCVELLNAAELGGTSCCRYVDLDAARLMLAQTNALVDAADAEREGRHLRLPSVIRG